LIVLDTNVVSEPLREKPDPKVLVWLNAVDPRDVFLTSITIFELMVGTQLMADGKRRRKLEEELRLQVDMIYANRILAFDDKSAEICARLTAAKQLAGSMPKLADFQIASIAIKHGYAIATRDTADFQHEGLRVINPWTD
jgi:toxin FitB